MAKCTITQLMPCKGISCTGPNWFFTKWKQKKSKEQSNKNELLNNLEQALTRGDSSQDWTVVVQPVQLMFIIFLPANEQSPVMERHNLANMKIKISVIMRFATHEIIQYKVSQKENKNNIYPLSLLLLILQHHCAPLWLMISVAGAQFRAILLLSWMARSDWSPTR